MLPTANQGGDNHMQIPLSSAYASVLPPGRNNLGPFNTVEFQPSEVCPQNFIIFDHTDNRSQIMFHPAIANKLSGPTANMCSKYIQKNFYVNDEHNDDREISSPLMEDLDDIDALLSLEDEDHEDIDGSEDEEISTARSHLNYGNQSPDSSSSSYSSKPRKNRSFNPVHKLSSSGRSSRDSDMKQLKVKKMMKCRNSESGAWRTKSQSKPSGGISCRTLKDSHITCFSSPPSKKAPGLCYYLFCSCFTSVSGSSEIDLPLLSASVIFDLRLHCTFFFVLNVYYQSIPESLTVNGFLICV
ncbi:Transcription factor basic helix-loop-helix 144, partial [Cucurbita argyrosperma subsp. sororia]